MERRNFLKCANLCGAGLLGLGAMASAQAADPDETTASKTQPPLTLRPYQLLCTICSLGDQAKEGKGPAKQYEKCKQVHEALRNNPDMPITLACHAGPLYAYQDSGTKDDTPEGDEFNRKTRSRRPADPRSCPRLHIAGPSPLLDPAQRGQHGHGHLRLTRPSRARRGRGAP